jgi:hypothetical protein
VHRPKEFAAIPPHLSARAGEFPGRSNNRAPNDKLILVLRKNVKIRGTTPDLKGCLQCGKMLP